MEIPKWRAHQVHRAMERFRKLHTVSHRLIVPNLTVGRPIAAKWTAGRSILTNRAVTKSPSNCRSDGCNGYHDISAFIVHLHSIKVCLVQ